MLWDELHTVYKFSFLRTRNLSQDCLEHFFSIIRWKNVNNNHPDASQFMSAFKSVVINQLLLPKKIGNVEADLGKYIVNREEIQQINFTKQHTVRPSYKGKAESIPSQTCDINQLSSIYWTTGWVCSTIKHAVCLKKIGSNAEQNDASFLTDFKQYTPQSKIMRPGEQIFLYFQGICRLFDLHFMELLKLGSVGVKMELMDIIQTQFNFPFVEISDDFEEECVIEEIEKQLLEVLCPSCCLKITEKYLNMLIGSKLSQMNNTFKINSDNKKKSKKNEKSKKLNINKLSSLNN